MHLRDADLFGDLRLRHVAEVAQRQDAAFALRQLLDERHQRLVVVDELQRGVLLPHRLGERGPLVVLEGRLVERDGPVGLAGLIALLDLPFGDVEVVGQFGGRGGTAEALSEFAVGLVERQPQLLEPARDAHRPAGVAEMASDLAHDRRNGV
ncbi:hypothetical protein GCM10027447_11300 [Glycomyces halotolerans]